MTSVSKKNEVAGGSEVVSFKPDLEESGDVVELAEPEKKKFGMAKTSELVTGHNGKRMGSFSDGKRIILYLFRRLIHIYSKSGYAYYSRTYQGWLVEGLDDGHPDSTAKMPITSMSIKGCYEELKSLKDVGIFSPARDYMSILILLRSILYAYHMNTLTCISLTCFYYDYLI